MEHPQAFFLIGLGSVPASSQPICTQAHTLPFPCRWTIPWARSQDSQALSTALPPIHPENSVSTTSVCFAPTASLSFPIMSLVPQRMKGVYFISVWRRSVWEYRVRSPLAFQLCDPPPQSGCAGPSPPGPQTQAEAGGCVLGGGGSPPATRALWGEGRKEAGPPAPLSPHPRAGRHSWEAGALTWTRGPQARRGGGAAPGAS